MKRQPQSESLKDFLSAATAQVSHLPTQLQAAAFSYVLEHGIGNQAITKPSIKKIKQLQHSAPSQLDSESKKEFGEFFTCFTGPDLNTDNHLLIAGAFAENQSVEKSFTLDEANRLLKDIARIKISNAGVYVKRLLDKKWIFSVGKRDGKFAYRVSAPGQKVLDGLRESPEQVKAN